jgi:large subunit ribosomal protein L23
MKKDPFSIVKRQVITEKANTLSRLKDLESNKCLKKFKKAKYVFFVDVKANKQEIKRAIEEIYKSEGVLVESVNTISVKKKPKMFKGMLGTTKKKKKAIVTLKEGCSIEEKK